jgi:hypothetical protein
LKKLRLEENDNMRTFLMLILLMLLLTGCQPAASQVATIQAKTSAPVFTESTSQVIPQQATSVQEKFPRYNETVEPSRTPSPIVTPPTATSDVTFLELPAWVKNPSNQIVLFKYDAYSTRSSQIGFFNAASGEQAIIRLPFGIYQYYWKDANHIVFLQGYCSEPLVGVTDLDILHGTLSPATAENLPGYIASCYDLEDVSATIKIDTTSPEPTVEILDVSSIKWLRVTHPNDGISDIHFALSPNGDYLGIVQVQGKYEFPELWQPLFGTQVSVYHLPDRKLVASFAEEKEVSAMLLFTDNETLVYVREHTPCVISITAKSKKCIHGVSDRFSDATIILGDPMNDRKKLSFLYFGPYPHRGGWCIYDLFSGGLNCPTDEFQDLQGQTVTNYALSPDNNYLLIEYDSKGCPPPWCDYFDTPQIAVIDLARGKFFKLGDSDTYEAMDIFRDTQPWRPSP